MEIIMSLLGRYFASILILFTPFSALAVPITIEITASAPAPATSGVFIIDFIDGDGVEGSSATIQNLSIPPSLLSGSVAQTGVDQYLFTDSSLLSSLYFYSSDVFTGFSFTVDANLVDPGLVGFPDSLVLSLTDSNGIPLFPTLDPRGADSLLVLSFNNQEIYSPQGFDISVSSEPSKVPEPQSLILITAGIIIFFMFRKKIAIAFLLMSIGVLASMSAYAALVDVTLQTSIQRAPLVYNRATGTYDGLVSVRNLGTNILNSPMFLVVSGMPETVSVNNATSISYFDGNPMLSLPVPSNGLAPGQTISNVRVKFHNPNNLRFTATFKVLSNSGELPPDPGEAGKEALAGVDSNNNGIRDDVEIYIDANFGNSQKLKEGLNQFAVSLQQGIIAASEQQSMLAANNQMRAMECLHYISPNDRSWKSVEAIAVNTPERLNAWLTHEGRLSGKVFPGLPEVELKNSCSFNPDILSN